MSLTQFVANIDFTDVLLGAALTLLLCLVFRVVSKKKSKKPLKKDKSGLFKYHEETRIKQKRALKSDNPQKVAVIEFDGDTKASSRGVLSKLVDEICINKEKIDEVVVVISSPGGMVPHYGHAYAEMQRLRDQVKQLTVCVNVVAASGGYLMSLPAHKIIAAPFSLVGSVGVVAFVPNLRQLLQNWNIQPRTFTAGNYKRTVTLTDDGDPEREKHLQEQIATIHRLFIDALKRYRPESKVEVISTGDSWTAAESVELGLGLVDEIGTSANYLLERNAGAELFIFSSEAKRKGLWSWVEKLFEASLQRA